MACVRQSLDPPNLIYCSLPVEFLGAPDTHHVALQLLPLFRALVFVS